MTCFTVQAQQEPQHTQYMYNTLTINPAYAGSRGMMSIFGMHRSQWVGLDGAPATSTFALHTPIKYSKLGLGFSFTNDQIGPQDFNSIAADLSYSLDFDYGRKLSFGFKVVGDLLNVDYTKLDIYHPDDLKFQSNIDNRFSPNFGAGIYWSTPDYYLGISTPRILETKFYDQQKESVVREKMHYYLIGGYVFDLTHDVKLKPAFMSKIVQGSPLQIDLSANALFMEKFTLGLAYRVDAAMSALAGFQLSDQLFIGYAYDAETTKLANHNSGSHEIFLRFELLGNYKRIITPRFF